MEDRLKLETQEMIIIILVYKASDGKQITQSLVYMALDMVNLQVLRG